MSENDRKVRNVNLYPFQHVRNAYVPHTPDGIYKRNFVKQPLFNRIIPLISWEAKTVDIKISTNLILNLSTPALGQLKPLPCVGHVKLLIKESCFSTPALGQAFASARWYAHIKS